MALQHACSRSNSPVHARLVPRGHEPDTHPHMPHSDTPESPRIRYLHASLTKGDGAALDAFWHDIEAAGAPIVEPIAGDDEHRLLTFVYRAEQPLENITIFPGIGRYADSAFHSMEQLADTDLWYRTYRVRKDLRAAYHFSPDDPLQRVSELSVAEQTAYYVERARAWTTDPLNPNHTDFTPGQAPQSYIELPDAPPQPYIQKRDGVPEGAIHREDLERDPFCAGRRIWTYLPPAYDAASGPYPLVLQFDGIISRKLALHTTLDNMVADGIIPPVVCVMMHNPDRMTELACNDEFTDWLANDFVPMWRAKYAITADPARTVVTGMSLGGLASAFCGLRHPDVFGNVLSQSGSYWWRPGETSGSSDGGDWQWLTREFEAAPQLPLRWYMDVGLLEDGSRPEHPTYPTMTAANRRLRDVLTNKGYEVTYTEFNGGHDYVSWRGTIADGLKALLGSAQES